MSKTTEDNHSIKYEKGSDSSIDEEVKSTGDVKSDAEKRFLRKLNLRLLPLASLAIFLQYVDKSALSIAAILGIIEDTGMTHAQYSWLGSLFYLGFFLYQFPNNYLLQKLPVGRYLGVMIILWGVVTIGTAFCQNFIQLAILRVFLGIFESATYPSLILIMSTMYRRSEQSACFGFLWLSNGLASIVKSASGYGIAQMKPVGGLVAWRMSFVIFGVITVGVGIIILFFLIDTPQSRWLSLTEEEKEIVKLRTQDNAVVRKGQVSKEQYFEALKEPRLWLIFISAMVNNFQNGGLIHFSNVLVKSLGFDTLDTILLQIPSGFVSALFVFGGVMLHRKTGQLCFSVMVLSTISGIGCLLLAVLPQNGIKLLAFYLSWPCTGAYTLIVSLISSTVSGYSKKIFYNGILMIAYTLGNFIGPLVILDHEAPAYKSAMWVYFAANVLVCVCFVLIRVWLSRLNVKKAPGRTNEPTDVNLNLTDREDPNYVYKF